MANISAETSTQAVPHEQVVIIGAGAAGLTAGIYTARANLNPVIIAGVQPGGQMTITTDVENYPGFANVIQGPWLMTEMQSQAENVGARVIYDIVTAVDVSSRPFTLSLDSGGQMMADAIILATGAQARWLGLDSEQAFNGRGVSACATCDGFFYKGREVAVIGGGNTAVEEALYLANICEKVTLVHRRDALRAEQIMQDRLLGMRKSRFSGIVRSPRFWAMMAVSRLCVWPRLLARRIWKLRSMACLLPLAMTRRQLPSPVSSISMRRGISLPKREERALRLPVFLPRVIALTKSTVRR